MRIPLRPSSCLSRCAPTSKSARPFLPPPTRRRDRRLASIACVLSLMAVPARAQPSEETVLPYERGGGLLRACQDAHSAREAVRTGGPLPTGRDMEIIKSIAECEFYIQGFMEGNQMVVGGERLYCPPEGVSLGQLYAVFRQYAEQHPELHHTRRAYLLTAALQQAFPCR